MSIDVLAMPALRDPSLFSEQSFIAGEWTASNPSARIVVTNPANGRTIGTVPRATLDQVRASIDAAQRALPAWSKKTGKERAAILRRWYDLMLEHQDDLATLMTCEQGKPLAESHSEIVYAASFIEWFAEEAKRVYGDTIPAPAGDRRIVVIKQPIGVCAAITPWNFPAAMLTRKIGPALAAGCTMVLKPASQTPFSALALCVLAERAGVPPGVLSCVTGNAALIGDELCRNPVVRKLSFTGSTEIGKLLLEKCAGTVKKTSMELGGNAPFIVFDDADLDAAVNGAITSKFRNAGQTCVCVNRFLVQEGVHDAFVGKLANAITQLKVGNGLDGDTKLGPLIDEKAVAKAQEHVDDALARGGKLMVGGEADAYGANFFQPTLLTGATRDMKIFREETFGPVAPIFRFSTEEEAIRLANDTEFGLASYFYGRDIGRIWRVAEALEYGMVGINEGLISTEVAPFGGIKESGLGREGSKYGIDDYLELKYLCMGGVA
ncbi:NAD-dependent succinate-semialdehyde dehydrogenase [Caballeronia sp. GAWG2-1]|uniref:NAD-dependent succinate-semialdehyde dehydrogenase n=1 Tax=Caballeronia sp. GAWG2-1 TaxID=2921744 RepID=UPI00202983ED|nr:NAD-dependent succinate-semialdehyde dehydrogenase [Caballeronia sp. GAWG2-1]